MELKISKDIRDTKIRYYADGKKMRYNIEIDCSDGENPYGCSKTVISNLQSIEYKDITKYSYDNQLKEEIAKYWNINVNNIVLCSGSVEGLYQISILFKTDKAKLLTYIPTFPNFVNYSKLLGYEYEQIKMEQKSNYKYNVEELIKNINSSINLIYIDNPNNPTGQIMDKNELIKIVQCSNKLGIGIIIDEAYGDYICKEESCIDLVNKYNNVMVIRTFSKGFGLAGLRAGYIVANEKICKYIEKMSHPYNISQVSRKLIISALRDKKFIEESKKKIGLNKKKLRDALPKSLEMAYTHESTSICLLYSNKDIDLCKEFAKKGIKVYSGLAFEGLNKNSVRLNLPEEEKMEELISIIRQM